MPERPADDEIVKRLEIIIMLLLEASGDAPDTMTAKIEKLLSLGLTKSEVARIVGKPLNYVSAVTTGKRKASRK